MLRFTFFLIFSISVFQRMSVQGQEFTFACDNFDECFDRFEMFVDGEQALGAEGDAAVVNGDLLLQNTLDDDNNGGTFLYIPEFMSGDTSLRVRAQIGEGGFGLISKFSGGWPHNGYWTSVSDEFNYLLGPVVNGDFSQFVEADVGQVAGIDTDVWMQLDAVGNSLKAWYWYDGDPRPDVPQVSFMLLEEQKTDRGFPAFWAFDGFTGVREFYVNVVTADFNGNGEFDGDDADALVGEIVDGTDYPTFDISRDGIVDDDDLTAWLAEASTQNGFGEAYLLGDANLDGTVGAADLNAMALNWRQDIARWTGGDFDASGTVDANDLNSLALNWQQSVSPAASLAAVVPEGSGVSLLLIGLACLCPRLRRGSRLVH